MDRALLESLSREHLIEVVLAQIQVVGQLTKRVEALEAQLGGPPKTPGNSSIRPSLGRKASDDGGGKPKGGRRGKGRKGSYRALHPNPTRIVALKARCCPHCQGTCRPRRSGCAKPMIISIFRRLSRL
jgi:hypothetical protein